MTDMPTEGDRLNDVMLAVRKLEPETPGLKLETSEGYGRNPDGSRHLMQFDITYNPGAESSEHGLLRVGLRSADLDCQANRVARAKHRGRVRRQFALDFTKGFMVSSVQYADAEGAARGLVPLLLLGVTEAAHNNQ
jgi:hypothetical protein